MSTTLFELTYRVARELHATLEGLLTSGVTNTLYDADYLAGLYNNDHWNRGTIWLLRDAGGAGAAPERQYRRISDFDGTAGSITLPIAFTGANAAQGDRYALANELYPIDQIVGAVNAALQEIDIPHVDVTMTTTTDQTEYTLPAAVQNLDGLEVWLQSYTNTGDEQYDRVHDWRVEETSLGAQKTLVFRSQPKNPHTIKLVYWDAHPSLFISTATLHEFVDPDRVVKEAARELLAGRFANLTEADPKLNIQLQDMTARAEREKWNSPLRKHKVKLASLGDMEHHDR